MKNKQSNGEIEIEIKDNAITTPIDGNYNLKVIQTRKEYVESLLNDFGSGHISRDKLIGELPKNLKMYILLLKAWSLMLVRLKIIMNFYSI